MDRRELLVCLGGAGMTASSGCLTSLPTLESVTPVEKRITGYNKEGTVTILERRYWSEKAGPEYRQDPDSPLDLPADDEPFLLDDDTYESLKSQFDELVIHMHVCTEGLHESGEWGCSGPQISWNDFNRFTLEDKLLIRFHTSSVEASVYRVHEGEGERNG